MFECFGGEGGNIWYPWTVVGQDRWFMIDQRKYYSIKKYFHSHDKKIIFLKRNYLYSDEEEAINFSLMQKHKYIVTFFKWTIVGCMK